MSEARGDARTLDSLLQKGQLPQHKSARERLGSIAPPLLKIEPDHIVPDELHLLLRISDVLTRNLILEIVASAKRIRQGSTPILTNLKKLETAVKECGITFRVWEVRDADGKPSGKYESTSLQGKDTKKLLERLPVRFADLLAEEVQAKMAQLWTVSNVLQIYLIGVCTITVVLSVQIVSNHKTVQ